MNTTLDAWTAPIVVVLVVLAVVALVLRDEQRLAERPLVRWLAWLPGSAWALAAAALVAAVLRVLVVY